MFYINLILFIVFLVLYVCSARASKDCLEITDKKEHKLYFLFPFVNFLLTKSGTEKILFKKAKVSNAVTALNVGNKPDMALKLYWYNKTSLVLFVIFLFNLLSLFSHLQSAHTQEYLSRQYLTRPDHGEGEVEAKLTVTANSDKDPSEKYIEDITVPVKELEYTEEELNSAMEDACSYLEKVVLGDNTAKDQIRQDLNFVSQIPGTSICVEWYPEDYSLISGEGKVLNEEIDTGGKNTIITAVLSYGSKRVDYRIKLQIFPKQLSAKEKFLKELQNELADQSKRTSRESRWNLPDQMGDYSLSWKEKKQQSGNQIFILGITAAAILWFYLDKDLEKKMEKRKQQMLLDYPEIINKFTLLVNAGMTIKQAWYKICEDYRQGDSMKIKARRYAYEEMLITVHELKLGVPEGNAYEQFGRRTGVLPFLKFSSLIAQNLKKGNRGLSELLSREANDAFEERKELAKRLGEEAGTKLLVPMMIMLVIVFVIILIPAFMSFRM